MDIFNSINENGYFCGISTEGGISNPIKPIVSGEKARFINSKWVYEFNKEEEFNLDNKYGLVGHSIDLMYTTNIKPLNGEIILEKSKDISILIPCYGKAKYIIDCVKSCINQTMKPYEIIIMLMDEESQLLEKELSSLGATCIISKRYNAVQSRNKLVNEYCNTDWFVLLDADDMISPNFLELSYKEEASVVFPRGQYCEENGEIGDCEDTSNITSVQLESHSNALFGNLTSLMNKQIFNEVGLDEKLYLGGEDFDFIIRLLSLSKYKVSYLRTIWYMYRKTNGLSNDNKFWDSHFNAIVKNIEFLHQEYVSVCGYNEIEDTFYHNPKLESVIPYSPVNKLDVLINKEKVLRYKLYLSKQKEPIQSFNINDFITIGDMEINELMYIGKEFDVIFNEEISHHTVISKNVNALINKNILPKIKDKQGLDLINYLLDNYCCFENENPPSDNLSIDEELNKLELVDDNTIKEQLKLVNIPKFIYFKNALPITISFILHRKCNLNCSYCNALNNINEFTDDEMYERFDYALTWIENHHENRPIHIGLLGGEPTLWSNYLIQKIMDRLSNYRHIMLYTNGIIKDSLWHKQDKIHFLTHVTDWKEHPEKLCKNNLLKNETPLIVITRDDLEDLDKVLSKIPNEKMITANPCVQSHNSEQDITPEDYIKLKEIIKKYDLNILPDCKSGNAINIDCNDFSMCKACCRNTVNVNLEEVLNINKELCKKCLFVDSCIY